MTVRELASPGEVLSPELRARAVSCGASCFTKHYIATRDGTEVAFIAVDWYPHDWHEQPAPLVLYQLFVPESLRRAGIGTLCLQWVEEQARVHGYSRVKLLARPIEPGVDAEWLQGWYRTRGYEPTEGEALQKQTGVGS